jgi:hypothetical protein
LLVDPLSLEALDNDNNQPVSDGSNKGGQWLAREHQQGDHTTTTVGNNKRQERAADDDGSFLK